MDRFPGPRRALEAVAAPVAFVTLEEAQSRQGDADKADVPLPGSELIDRPTALAAALKTFPASTLAGKTVPPRQSHVEGLVPARTVTLFGGDGGTGKSQVAKQLAFATASRSTWLGLPVAGGSALYVTAEDETDEVHRRLEAIVAEAGTQLEELADLHIVCLAGEDALLAVPGPRGALQATPLFEALRSAIVELEPALVVLDTLADLFGGEENSRTHARQFIGMLRGLALKHDTTILLLAHPSLSGMSSGAGTSGSTAWSNSVRSRLYLERAKGEAGAEVDPDVRVLRVLKANYAPTGTEIRMRWQRGVFVPIGVGAGGSGLAAYVARDNADRVFLDMLNAYAVEKRDVSPSKSTTYAPTVFAQDARSQGLSMRALQDAMNRLLASGRVKIVEEGPQSKRRKRLIVGPADPVVE